VRVILHLIRQRLQRIQHRRQRGEGAPQQPLCSALASLLALVAQSTQRSS
jgi:hypothetical protein